MTISGPKPILPPAGALAAATLAALVAYPAPSAQACGGFFCSQSQPVNQSAEQIIFVHDDDKEQVTAVIQIQYQGPSEKFAWLLPVPGVPEVGVSSNTALQNLQFATDPQYQLEVEVEGECDEEYFDDFGAQAGGMAPTAAPEAQSDKGVSIEAEGSVGPYDYVVISIDSKLSDPADTAVDWLTDNGYDVTSVGPDVLRPYLEDGLNLLAFRLTKGNESGAIRPVMITYDSNLPMIPIRPTAVAAQNDMGILVWVVAGAQAIPKNYKSLVLNEALINWFNFRSNYDQVVTEAANQSGGQGFVTELAGDSRDYDEAIFGTAMEQQWMQYSQTSFVDGFDAIQQASWQYRGWDGWREAIAAAVALPPGVSLDDFGQNPDAYRDQVQIDSKEFITNLYENVIKPVIDTQDLILTRPYLTRLYSTMSADEMTLDPLFDFNSDLADVSNIHMAKQFIQCSEGMYQWEAPWRIELPNGAVVRGDDRSWPIEIDDLPANMKIVQLSTEGSGDVVEDNTEDILEKLFEQSGMTATVMPGPIEGMEIGGGDSGDSGGWICSVPSGGRPLSGATLLPLLACLLLLQRRRR